MQRLVLLEQSKQHALVLLCMAGVRVFVRAVGVLDQDWNQILFRVDEQTRTWGISTEVQAGQCAAKVLQRCCRPCGAAGRH